MLYGDGVEPYGFSFFTAVKISTTNSEVFNVVKQMCRGEGVRFVDYYQLPGICGKQELFNDYMHMNDRGARLYSKQIGTFVKDYMNVQEIQ